MADTPRRLPERGEELAEHLARTLAHIAKALARVGIHLPPPNAGPEKLEKALEKAYFRLRERTLPPQVGGPLLASVHAWLCALDVTALYINEPSERRYLCAMDEMTAAEVLTETAMRFMGPLN